MNFSPSQLLLIAVFALAGLCLFLLLLNRRLILMRDRPRKKPIIFAVLLAVTGGAAAAGVLLPLMPWILAPAGILALIAAGEVRRLLIRRRAAGSPPVERPLHPLQVSNPLTTTDLAVHRYELPLDGWTGVPFRIVHLTDLHVNRAIPDAYFEEVLTVADGLRPDLAFFTGDFLTKARELPALIRLLRPVKGAWNFAILGNHDYWTDPRGIAGAIEAAGITLLGNGSEKISLGGHSLRITGFEYPWGTSSKEIEPAPPGPLHLVLTHTPDNIYPISRCGADCVFSGHNHAGQVRIPFLGPIVVPSIYGRRFDHGHFVIKGTHFFVSGGVGAGNPTFRVYCNPDIFVIDVSGKAAR